MSMRIGTYGNQSVKRLELKRADGTVAGSVTIRKAEKKKRKKKIQYNFKEISGRIMRSKTSGTARQTLVSARQKVVALRRMWITRYGVYDDRELYHAIVHAEAIARVAKKRLKHLQEEERADKQGGPCEAEQEEKSREIFTEEMFGGEELPEMDPEELQELMQECQEMLQEALEELERISSGMGDLAEEMMLADTEDMDPEDLEQLKRKHRADELRDIMLADMRYLKAMFDKLAKEKESGGSGIGEGGSPNGADSGVSLELSGLDIPVEAPAPTAAELVEGAAVDASV